MLMYLSHRISVIRPHLNTTTKGKATTPEYRLKVSFGTSDDLGVGSHV
jgi:hypothetical protein